MPSSPSPPIDASSERRLEPIASTKLIPPRGARRLMPREALLQRLQEARRRRCVVVQGPAGCGKTSTLVAWRQALLALDFDVAWLTLVAEDDEPTRFFDCLLAALAEVDTAIVRETAKLMGRDSDESAAEHWVITLVQDIAARPRELVLMLDDLQQLQDARIFQALQWLLDYAPPNLHLVFGSRNALPLALGRLRAQGQVAEFDLRDLRFTPEESERFLREQLGSIEHRDAQVLHGLTDGWVAGLQLFVLDLKGKQGRGYAPVQVRDPQAFASYFEREVLVRLAADDLELLTRMAVCNRFCASLCAALSGQPHAVAQMTTRLARLDTDDLFISQVSSHDRESWYRLHPLLREVLIGRLAALPALQQQALHGAAWRWFDAHGHIDEAVRHAVLAGEAQAAADLVEAHAVAMLSRGELTLAFGLVRRLPAEQVQQRFGLQLVRAHLHLFARDFAALEADLRRMESGFGALDARQRYGVTLLRGAMALQRDDSDAAGALRAELEAIPDDAYAYAFAGQRQVLAWLHMQRSEFEQAYALCAESARSPTAPRGQLVARCLEGQSLALEGRMADAERVLRDALQRADTDPAGADPGVASLAAGLLSDTLYEANELEAAQRLLEPRIDLIERAATPDAALRALVVLACVHWLGGNRLEGLAVVERLEDHAARHGMDRLLAHAWWLHMRWHLSLSETVAAQEVAERLVALGERHAAAGPGTGAETRRTVERARAELSLHWKDFDAAIQRLQPLLAEAQALRRWRSVATLHLLLATARAGRGQADAARTHVVEALRIGHRLGLLRSLLDASPDVARLIGAALDDDALDPVLGFYARRLLAAAAARRRSAAEAPQPRPAAAEAFSEREREVLELIAQAMPNKKIARVLGVTPHTVKWHLRKIYAKLGVTERDQAVARMRDLAARESPKGTGSAG